MKKENKKYLGVSLSALAFSLSYGLTANAQTCVTPPSCETLGFTKTAADCEGKSILKCPFDTTKVYCPAALEQGDVACGILKVGDILYSDMSCSESVDRTKTAIGIIFDVPRRLALSLTEKKAQWSTTTDFDIPELVHSSRGEDYAGKNNTKKIVDYCKANGKSCPAAEYAYSYKTIGTRAGDWYLPAEAELNLIYQQKAKLDNTISLIGADRLRNDYYWSSSEYDNNNAWPWDLSGGYMGDPYYGSGRKTGSYGVRPVLAF